MSPYQHGEVFVTEDGAETDLDLGHYERFIDENLNKFSNLPPAKCTGTCSTKSARANTSARRCRSSRTSPTKSKNSCAASGARAARISSLPRSAAPSATSRASPHRGHPPDLHGAGQGKLLLSARHARAVHLRLVRVQIQTHPALGQRMQGMGIAPDIIVARVDMPLPDDIKRKIAMFCNVRPDCVIETERCPAVRGARDAGRGEPLFHRLRKTGAARGRNRSFRMERHAPPRARLQRPRAHRPVRQVRATARRLPLRGRIAAARGVRKRGESGDRVDRQRNHHRGERGADFKGRARHSGAGRVRRPRHRGARSPRRNTRAKTTCRTWESVWVCRWRSSNLRGTC